MYPLKCVMIFSSLLFEAHRHLQDSIGFHPRLRSLRTRGKRQPSAIQIATFSLRNNLQTFLTINACEYLYAFLTTPGHCARRILSALSKVNHSGLSLPILSPLRLFDKAPHAAATHSRCPLPGFLNVDEANTCNTRISEHLCHLPPFSLHLRLHLPLPLILFARALINSDTAKKK